MASFPEIRAQDAPADIAAIYADIRAVSGAPVVNLIWRHFAALPGVLDWAWTAVRPLVGSRQMQLARTRIGETVVLPQLPPPGPASWREAGLDATGIADLAAMIGAYVRGNMTNMVALTALRLRLDDPHGATGPLTPAEPAKPASALAPLAQIDALDPALAARIRAISARHEGASGGVIPSVYLELARWPGVLAALPDWLAPLYDPPALRAARDSTIHMATTEAAAMLPAVGPAPAGLAAMRPALEHFTRLVIPDLIPVCIAVQRLLPRDG